MKIKDDMTRLFKLYLDALDKLKQSLPSQHIQDRIYHKRMKQTREQLSENNYHFSTDSFRRSEHSLGSISSSPSTKGSLSSVSQLSQSVTVKPIEENEVTVETPCTPFLTLINAGSSETKQ